MFFFYFETVLMRDKDSSEKSFELLGHLDGSVFEFFFKKFSNDRTKSEAGKDFKVVRWAFLDKFSRNEEPQEVV